MSTDPVTVTISTDALAMLNALAFAQLEVWRLEDPTRRSTDVVIFPDDALGEGNVIVRLYPDANGHPAKAFRGHAPTLHEAAAIALREARA